MEHKLNSIILLPIFIILLVVIFRTIKDSLKFDAVGSLILSICVSVLATIGLNSSVKGTVGVVLIPYAALAICIFLAFLIAFLFKTHKKAKDRFSNTFKKNPQPDINEKRKYEIDDDRMKR
jgi:energy-coupling factor transporter transmembrane protein EcfT